MPAVLPPHPLGHLVFGFVLLFVLLTPLERLFAVRPGRVRPLKWIVGTPEFHHWHHVVAVSPQVLTVRPSPP